MVGGSLVQILLNDVLEGLNTSLQALNSGGVVLAESEVLSVVLHLGEALNLEVRSLQVQPKVIDVGLQLLQLEIDFGGATEAVGPFEEA